MSWNWLRVLPPSLARLRFLGKYKSFGLILRHRLLRQGKFTDENRYLPSYSAVPTETCVTAVTTRNDDGVPTTSSILSCAATATITLVTVTAASVTQISLGSNYTGGHVSSSQASVESAVSKVSFHLFHAT